MTKQIMVGNVPVGGGAPVSIQSMCNTFTHDVEATVKQINLLAAAGCDISRPVLVGDRHHDVEGGAAQGVPVIFVRWGFSWPHEADGAAASVETIDELRALLLIDDDAADRV